MLVALEVRNQWGERSGRFDLDFRPVGREGWGREVVPRENIYSAADDEPAVPFVVSTFSSPGACPPPERASTGTGKCSESGGDSSCRVLRAKAACAGKVTSPLAMKTSGIRCRRGCINVPSGVC